MRQPSKVAAPRYSRRDVTTGQCGPDGIGGESGEWLRELRGAEGKVGGCVGGGTHARAHARARAWLPQYITASNQATGGVSHLVMANLTNPLLLPALAVMPQCGLWERTDSMGTGVGEWLTALYISRT